MSKILTDPQAALERPGIPEYSISSIPPTGAQYLSLRDAAGLTPPPTSPSLADDALSNSMHILVARVSSTSSIHESQSRLQDQSQDQDQTQDQAQNQDNEPIGMIRLVGDKHIFLTIYDVCVLPAHRGKGIASRLLDEMLSWIDEHAPDAYVSLIGDPPGQAMYARKGFVRPEGVVMVRSRWGR